MDSLRRFTSLFRFIELCTFFYIISTIFSTLSAQYYFNERLYITLISPLFVFLLGNAIVIILILLKSRESSAKDDSSTVVDYKTCIIPSLIQVKRKMCRSHSEKKLINKLSHGDVSNNRVLRRSATIACGRYGEKPVVEMTGEEFRYTVEAFIARQQRFLREEEFLAVVSTQL